MIQQLPNSNERTSRVILMNSCDNLGDLYTKGTLLLSCICFCSPSRLNLLHYSNTVKWNTCDINLCYELIYPIQDLFWHLFFYYVYNIINNEKIFRICLLLLWERVIMKYCTDTFVILGHSVGKNHLRKKWWNKIFSKQVKIHILVSSSVYMYYKLSRIILLARTVLSDGLA